MQTETLVVDRSFEIRTSDPQRAFEPTASIVDRAIYDTLLTFKGGDVSRPLPMAAQSFQASRDAKTYTFQLRRDIRFADGTPMTAADVVFSFRRLINLKGNPSFLLGGVRVSATGKYTVVLRSATPNTALPAIVANTSLGIVNSKLAKRNGATAAVGADKTDKAEKWFNSRHPRRRGGPYLLRQYSTTSQIVLEQNPRYWGRKPAFERVVIRNMIAATQFVNVQRGTHEVAIDLSAQHAQSLRNSQRVGVTTQPSTWVFWLFANNNPSISAATPNKRFHPPFATPSTIARSWNSPVPERSRRGGSSRRCSSAHCPRIGCQPKPQPGQSELAASGVGDQTFTVEYPSDLTINGVAFATLAQRVQANLEDIGLRSSWPVLPSARGSTSTGTARWPSACPSGARTIPTRPTTWPSCRASSSARVSAGRRAPTRRSSDSRRGRGSRPATSPERPSTGRSSSGSIRRVRTSR